MLGLKLNHVSKRGYRCLWVNTLRHDQHDQHIVSSILKCTALKENCYEPWSLYCGDRSILGPSYSHSTIFDIEIRSGIQSLFKVYIIFLLQGDTSIWKKYIAYIMITIIKVKQSCDSVTFIIGIPIPRKTVVLCFLNKTSLASLCNSNSVCWNYFSVFICILIRGQ